MKTNVNFIFKMNRAGPGDPARLGGGGLRARLEALVLGITGKKALWEALALVVASDPRLSGLDFDQLARSAQAQIDVVNARRLRLAPEALTVRVQGRA